MEMRGRESPAERRKVRVVLEAANGPMTAEASDVLEDRGVLAIPDILANAGGVTCSYFEQVQGNANYYWSGDEVLRKVDAWMTNALERCTTELNRIRFLCAMRHT